MAFTRNTMFTLSIIVSHCLLLTFQTPLTLVGGKHSAPLRYTVRTETLEFGEGNFEGKDCDNGVLIDDSGIIDVDDVQDEQSDSSDIEIGDETGDNEINVDEDYEDNTEHCVVDDYEYEQEEDEYSVEVGDESGDNEINTDVYDEPYPEDYNDDYDSDYEYGQEEDDNSVEVGDESGDNEINIEVDDELYPEDYNDDYDSVDEYGQEEDDNSVEAGDESGDNEINIEVDDEPYHDDYNNDYYDDEYQADSSYDDQEDYDLDVNTDDSVNAEGSSTYETTSIDTFPDITTEYVTIDVNDQQVESLELTTVQAHTPRFEYTTQPYSEEHITTESVTTDVNNQQVESLELTTAQPHTPRFEYTTQPYTQTSGENEVVVSTSPPSLKIHDNIGSSGKKGRKSTRRSAGSPKDIITLQPHAHRTKDLFTPYPLIKLSKDLHSKGHALKRNLFPLIPNPSNKKLRNHRQHAAEPRL